MAPRRFYPAAWGFLIQRMIRFNHARGFGAIEATLPMPSSPDLPATNEVETR